MLRITGAEVYDPANGVHGEVKDICIADGKVVAEVQGGRTINATGMIVFPGGVDIHTHVAGAALNFARAMTPENQRAAVKFLQLGQSAGQRLLESLRLRLPELVAEAARLEDEDIGSTTPGAMLASCWHETQYTRLFRS